MADTQNNQKYFLDLGGLTSLWNKIKTSFADKEQTESSIGNINIELGSLDTRISAVDNDVNNLEIAVLTFSPKEVDYYKDAVEASKSLAVGTMINVRSEQTSADDETPSGYSKGIYIVAGPGEILYVSTSDGDSDGSSITALGERVTSLEETTVKTAQLIDENGTTLGQSFSVVDNVLLIAHDNTFDINSNSVRALTHKAVAAKFKDIENTLTKIPKFKISVVEELPKDGISLSTIYLLKNSDVTDSNLFTEYIYVEQENDGKLEYAWEKLGEQTLIVDNIVTNDKLNEVLSNALSIYAKKTDVQELVNQATENLRSDILSEVESTYATIESVENISKEIEDINGALDGFLTKNDAELNYLSKNEASDIYLSKNEASEKGWMTEAEIITSIQLGNIGEAILITEEQIENIVNPS